MLQFRLQYVKILIKLVRKLEQVSNCSGFVSNDFVVNIFQI